MIQDPIFIVGSERSGSSMLRLLLNESKEVAVPHPPHLMRDLSPIAPRYGALTKDEIFKRLIRHAIKLIDLHYAPWPFKPDLDQVFETAGKRTLYAVYAGLYEQYRAHKNKPRWGCKSTFMIHHVGEVLRHHKRPKFVHLVRDPRDVAVSARNSLISHYHPYYTAQLWAREQRLAMEWSRKLSPDVWHTLRFEDLLADPVGQLRKLCGFLEIEYSANLLRFFEKPAARSRTSGKYLAELSVQEILMVESFTRQIMAEFDYKPVSESEHDVFQPGVIQELSFQLSENLSMLREEARAVLFDRSAISRLRKKAFLWRLSLRSTL